MGGGWRRGRAVAVLAALVAGAPPTQAEAISQLWRSPFGNPRAVAVSGFDGSCWAAMGSSVMCMSALGVPSAQIDGFSSPFGLAINSADGSCWVADTYHDQVVHLSKDGTELWRGGVFIRPTAIAVDPTDGSCWVADSGRGHLVHMSADGTEVARRDGYVWPDPETVVPAGRCLAVDPGDGSCWAADEGNGRVVHLSAGGDLLSQNETLAHPRAVSLDTTDGSCWVADPVGGRVAHLDSSGSVSWEGADFGSPVDLSVCWFDGSCSVADAGSGLVRRIEADGTEAWQWSGGPRVLAVSPLDGSCWVGNRHAFGSVTGRYELVYLTSKGVYVARHSGFTSPVSVSVDHVRGSCWVADYEGGRIARIAHDHSLAVDRLEPSQYQPRGISANTSDGSCWVAEAGGGLLRVSLDGVELLRDRHFMIACVSTNSVDGSCWAGVIGGGTASANAVYHFGQGAIPLWHRSGFLRVSSVCVNAADHSCWVADQDADLVMHFDVYGSGVLQAAVDSPRCISVNAFDASVWIASADEAHGTSSVSHLAEDGTVLWTSDAFSEASSVAANPTDGSCWVADWGTREVIHLAEDGAELGRVTGLGHSRVSVSPVDGSCWACDEANGQVVHLGVSGYEGPTFPDVVCYHWCYNEVEACADAGIVSGYDDGQYHGEVVVSRDQMAVYISRALAGGDENVDPPVGPPTFADVPAEYWAHKYVEYAASRSIVSGYDDGLYHPYFPVDRAQMAVYIARAIVEPTGDDGLSDYLPPPTPTFWDVTASSWAFLYVEYCAGEGIVQGYLDGRYLPANQVTRDQMSVYVCRAFDLSP